MGLGLGSGFGFGLGLGLGFWVRQSVSDSEQSDEHDEKPWSGVEIGSGRVVRVRIRF